MENDKQVHKSFP